MPYLKRKGMKLTFSLHANDDVHIGSVYIFCILFLYLLYVAYFTTLCTNENMYRVRIKCIHHKNAI